MNCYSFRVLLLSLIVCSAGVALSQQQPGGVPRVIRFTGTLQNVDGTPRTGTAGVSFSIYADDKTTVPLWQEMQNVTLDATGHYTVLLGATSAEGLPDALFADNTARWLGIRVESEPEQPRVLLAAVPYALKAADAETLGGKPLSAFVLNESAGTTGSANNATGSSSTTSSTKLQPNSINTTGSSGTQNSVAKWIDNAGTLGNSTMIDTGSAVGVGKTPSLAAFDVNGSGAFAGGLLNVGGSTIFQTDDPSVAPTQIILKGQTNPNQQLLMGYSTTGDYAAIQAVKQNVAYEPLNLNVAGGNVGIGKTNPTVKLDVNGAGAFAGGFTNVGGSTVFQTDDPSVAPTQIILKGQTNPNQQLLMGYSTSGDYAAIQAIKQGTAYEPLALNVAGGNVGIGTTAPSQKLDVNGNINASGNLSANGTITANTFSGSGASLTSLSAANLSGAVPNSALSGTYSNVVTLSNTGNSLSGNGAGLTSVNAASVSGAAGSTLKTHLITYLGGCDSCSVLTTADNQNLIYQNLLGATLNFASITCYSDVGTPSIDIALAGVGNVTSSSIACDPSAPVAVTTFSQSTIPVNGQLNFKMTSPGSTTHRVTVIIKATL